MATFEEKILAYLDGSLSGEDREDVLAQIEGGNAGATQLFSAHQRLESLYALTATPVSAPLSLQRELASKVPVLAIKLPYLAMPEKRRKRAAAWLWELPSFRLNAILILLTALLAGGIWYALDRAHGRSVSQTIGTTPHSSIASSSSGNAAKIAGPARANNAGTNIPSRSMRSKSVHSTTNTQATHPSQPLKLQSSIPNNRNSIADNRNSIPHNANSISNNTNSIPNHSNSESNNASSILQNKSSMPSIVAVIKEPSAVPQKALERIVLPTPDTFGNLPPPELKKVVIPEQPPIANNPNTMGTSKLPPLDTTPMIGETRNAMLQIFGTWETRILPYSAQPNPSAFAKQQGGLWGRTLLASDFEFGVDYLQLGHWLSLGVRASYAPFIREQEVIHTESLSGDNHLSKKVSETILTSSNSAWYAPSLTFSPNPGERLNWTFTAIGGDVFANGWLVRGEVGATYLLWSGYALRAAASYEFDRISPASPIDSSTPNSSMEAGAAISSTAGWHQSQGFGISLGISLRP